MKKLLFLLLFIPLMSFGQVGQVESDDWPEPLYVSGIEISNIPADLINVSVNCVLINCDAYINWGQKQLKDFKGKLLPSWNYVVKERVPTKKNRLKFNNKMAFFNYLENKGWFFVDKVGEGNLSSYLFRRK